MLKDFSKRSSKPELMDDFQGGIISLRKVFDDINRVNRILRGNAITVKEVAKLIRLNPKDQYTIVDMGCGDGNMLREIATYCRNKNIKVRLIGIDLNREALQLAREWPVAFEEISYRHQDILQMNPDEFKGDIVINTLCMHHFTEEQLPIFLNKFVQLADIGVVINDLQRSLWAYYLFKVFSLIFIKTKTAEIDGLISISKGFVKADLLRYASKLPTVTHVIKWKWAFRYVWTMQPNRLTNV